MFLTDGYNIKLPRGDSADIKFIFTDGEDTPYFFPADSYALIEVFPVKGSAPVISKRAERSEQLPDGSVTVSLTASDTDVPAAVYLYTIRIKNENGSVCDTRLGFNEDAYFAVGTDCPKRFEEPLPDSITVTVEQTGGALPPYTGNYTVEPAFSEDITLDTSGHSMTDNITVRGIPITETENSAGGITVTIG